MPGKSTCEECFLLKRIKDRDVPDEPTVLTSHWKEGLFDFENSESGSRSGRTRRPTTMGRPVLKLSSGTEA